MKILRYFDFNFGKTFLVDPNSKCFISIEYFMKPGRSLILILCT